MKRDWLRRGSEPSISELLDDPTTHAIMRHDGLRAEQIWKVVDKAKRKLTLRAAARHRREIDEPKQRSIWDGPGLPAVMDLNPIDSLGEWPDMFGVAARRRPDPHLRGARSLRSGARGGDTFDPLEPRVTTRPTEVVAFIHGRNKPLFRARGYTAGSSDRNAAVLASIG